MRSKASLKSHPLHPILVTFPIAFYTGTFIFDVLGVLYENKGFGQTAHYLNLAAIVAAVAAAIPGIIDFRYTVPPASSAKTRAAKHGLINTSVLIVFVVIAVIRDDSGVPAWLILLLEAIGLVLMFVAGWMGGTLVHRNQIGIDIRYANAGKWKEKYFSTSEKSIEVGNINEFKFNQMQLLHVNGQRIVIAKTETGHVAFADRCCHKGGSLAAGAMICETVQCPWHGSQFNVRTGVVVAGPAKDNIRTYSLQEKDGRLFLQL
jgi:uncharacterized membrane protein/nitrite reductase/ring-hydroxylating ferredoxin subunit